MTIPIEPGPFSFLAEAGGALGSYEQAKQEREHHAQILAEHGMTQLMQDILNGVRPADVLQDPVIQQMSKKAYGFIVPPHILPQPKEIQQRKTAAALQAQSPGGASERLTTGVQSEEVAAAGESVKKLEGAKAESQLTAGVPDAEALATAAEATARTAGAALNKDIFTGAQELLGHDKQFAKLSYEAATGALDYRIRLMQLNRENLTLERQRMADKARFMLEGMRDAKALYSQKVTEYEKQRRLDIISANGDPDDEKAQQKYEAAHPRPTYQEETRQYIQDTFGVDQAEFQKILREGIGASGVTDDKVPVGAGAAAEPTGTKTTPEYKRDLNIISSGDPKVVAAQLLEAVERGARDIFYVRLMFSDLKKTLPAAKYKALRKAYNEAAGPFRVQEYGIP